MTKFLLLRQKDDKNCFFNELRRLFYTSAILICMVPSGLLLILLVGPAVGGNFPFNIAHFDS